MFDSVNSPKRIVALISSGANLRKKSGLPISRAIIVTVLGMLLMATSLFSTAPVFSKRVGANSLGLTPPAPGTLTVKMTGTAVAAPTDTFTLRKQVFVGSTNCGTGGGSIIDVTGVNAATGTPISFTGADSVLLVPFITSDRNGQVSGIQNPDGLTLNFLPGNAVCVAGFDTVSHNILAQYGPGVETFAFDTGGNTCTTTPKFLFNLGEKVCYRVSGSGGTGGTHWGLTFSGGQPNQCNIFFPAPEQITAETVSGNVTLPATNGAVPGGCAGNPTTDVRGEWSAQLRDSGVLNGGNFKAEKRFRLHNSASLLAALNVSKTTNDTGYPPASGAGSPSALIHYSINVGNQGQQGPDPATNVSLVESVPAGTTFVSFTQTSGLPFTCGPPAGGNITCTIVSLPPDTFAAFEMVVSYINKTAGDVFNNTATISSTTPELNNADNTVTVPVPVQNPPNANVGQFFCRPDITVNSTGPTGAMVDYANIPPAPPVFTKTLPYTASIFAPAPPSNSLFPIGTNFVTVDSNSGSGHCDFKVIVIDGQHSDMTVTKTNNFIFVQGQVGAQYTIIAKNIGALATSGTVTVADTPPSGMTVTGISGNNWTCDLPTLKCTRSDPLASGGSYDPITVTVNVTTYFINNGNPNPNTATVSGGGQVITANDTATDTAQVLPLGTVVQGAGPTINAGAVTGTIAACVGSASASPKVQQFTVSGSSLTANISVNAPASFEVSTNAGSGYGNSLSLTQAGGNVPNTVIFVRSAASAPTGPISGNVTLTSAGATTINVAISGAINPVPQINAVVNQTYCAGLPVPSVVFTSNVPGATFAWSRTNEAIGLGTNSGTGNVPAFTATNAGATPLTSTFSAVASFTNNGVTCTGTPIQFTITVNPNLPLTITCPGGVTKFADSGQLGANINPGVPVTTGGCIPVTTNGVRSDGKSLNALYPIGVTMITWTAMDASNQMATCSQSIAVMAPSGQRHRPEEEEALLMLTDILIACFSAFW